MKERLHYVDVMKGITMLVVVFHHILWITVDLQNVTNPTVLWLHSWQDMFASFIMPAFFFTTGYCSNFSKPFKTFFINNFKSLIIPSFTIGIAIELIYGRYNLLPYFNLALHKGFLSFWFLYALFYSKLYFWFLVKVSNRKWVILIILIISSFLGTACNDYNILGWNFAQYRQVLNLTLYLGIGYYIKEIHDQKRIYIPAVLFVIGIIISRILNFTIPSVTAGFKSELSTEWLHLFFALTGTFFIFSISYRISKTTWIEAIGRNSLIIYLLHNSIILHSTKLYLKHILNNITNPFFTILLLILTIALATGITYYICVLLNTKYLKWTLGKF